MKPVTPAKKKYGETPWSPEGAAYKAGVKPVKKAKATKKPKEKK